MYFYHFRICITLNALFLFFGPLWSTWMWAVRESWWYSTYCSFVSVAKLCPQTSSLQEGRRLTQVPSWTAHPLPDCCLLSEALRCCVLDWQWRSVSPCSCLLYILFFHFMWLSSIMRIFRSPTVKCFSSWWALWSACLTTFLWKLHVLFQKISQEKWF